MQLRHEFPNRSEAMSWVCGAYEQETRGRVAHMGTLLMFSSIPIGLAHVGNLGGRAVSATIKRIFENR
jgi:hypothetical protein